MLASRFVFENHFRFFLLVCLSFYATAGYIEVFLQYFLRLYFASVKVLFSNTFLSWQMCCFRGSEADHEAAKAYQGKCLLPYSVVKDFVEKPDAAAEKGKKEPTTCSPDFQSNNNAAKRSTTYGIQSLVSIACPHSRVISAVLCWFGERFGNYLGLSQHLYNSASLYNKPVSNQPRVMYYDVACQMGKYFQNTKKAIDSARQQKKVHPLLDKLTMPTPIFALGKWHKWNHPLSCQLDNSALFKKGTGNISGMNRHYELLKRVRV